MPPIDKFAALFDSSQYTTIDDNDVAILAQSSNPTNGLDPFKYPFAGTETRVRFFSDPSQLGKELQGEVASHWPKGAVGMVLFHNDKLQSVGGTFITTATKSEVSPWAKILDRPVWQAFGGTMFATGDFSSIMTAMMDKSMAMALKGRFVDTSLTRVGKPLPGLGGSKSGFAYSGAAEVSRKEVIKNYARFQQVLGINITGGDQGFGEDENDIAKALAPTNFCTSLLTRGFDPTSNTAPGIIKSLELLLAKNAEDFSFFVQGVGGIGSMVADHFIRAGKQVFATDNAISSARVLELFGKDSGRNEKFVFDISGRVHFTPTPHEQTLGINTRDDLWSFARSMGWQMVEGLASALAKFPEVNVFVPCASVHPLVKGVRDYLAKSQVKIVLGSTNNVHETDNEGAYTNSVWELNEAGIWVMNDSKINRGGATGVVAGISGLTEDDMAIQHDLIGTDGSDAYDQWLEDNIPSQIAGDNDAAQLSNNGIDVGLTMGAYLPVQSTMMPVPAL